MRVGDENRIELRKLIKCNAWRRDPRKKSGKGLFEIRISQNMSACQF